MADILDAAQTQTTPPMSSEPPTSSPPPLSSIPEPMGPPPEPAPPVADTQSAPLPVPSDQLIVPPPPPEPKEALPDKKSGGGLKPNFSGGPIGKKKSRVGILLAGVLLLL